MAGNGSPKTAAGRPSPAVYRRRRLVAALLAFLVAAGLIAGIIAVVNAVSGGDAAASEDREATMPGPQTKEPGQEDTPADPAVPSAGASPGPQASDAPGAEASASPGAGAACAPGAIQVNATTDSTSYPAGASPTLSLTVTNTGDVPCDVNVGTSQMEFMVASGSDRIFSSVDCQQASEDLVKTIKPQTVETAKFVWNRQRSAPGCSPVASNPNPGTYVYTVRLGELSSEKTIFDLE